MRREDDPETPSHELWGDISSHLRKLKVSQAGIDFIAQTVSAPSRYVSGNHSSNVSSHRPSQKNLCTIQAESGTIERPFSLDLEYASTCKWFFDQVVRAHLELTRSDGRRWRRPYAADFLSIEASRVVVYELKTLEDAQILVQDSNSGWSQDGRRFRWKAAEVAFAAFGFDFEIKTSDDVSVMRADNLALMLHVRTSAAMPPGEGYIRSLRSLLRQNKAMTLATLADALGSPDVTPLIQLIDSGHLFTDLERMCISVAESCYVALTAHDLGPVLDGFEKIQSLCGSTGVSTADAPVPKEAYRIALRLKELESETSTKCAKTLSRYRKAIASKGVMGLQSGYANCGLKGSQLHEHHDRLIARVQISNLGRKERRSLSSAYDVYLVRFERRKSKGMPGFEGMSVVYETFRKRKRQLDHKDLSRRRGGRRLANAVANPTDPTKRSLPALRPFQRAHLDHYLADIFFYVIYSGGQAFALRPWVTFLIDELTRMILAFAITLGAPSRRSVARVLRDCVRRWKRLPEGIITDWGADFQSNFFHDFLARALIEKFQRPTAAGRWGQEVERSFGIYKTQCLSFLPGNTAEYLTRRSIATTHQPENQAQINLPRGFAITEAFTQSWLNQNIRGNSTIAPALLMSEQLSRYPHSGYPTEMNEAFLINTCIPASKREYKIVLNKGIGTQRQTYWDAAFAGIPDTHIRNVGHDPEDDSLIYATIGNAWHALRSRQWNRNAGMDRALIMSNTIRRQEAREAVRDAKRHGDAEHGRFLMTLNKAGLDVCHSPDTAAEERVQALRASVGVDHEDFIPLEMPEYEHG